MKHIQFAYPVFKLLLLFTALSCDDTGILRVGILASLLHECGHIVVWVCFFKELPVITIGIFGISLKIKNKQLTNKQLLVLAAAGPLVNLALAGLSWAVIQWRANYWSWVFLCANILIAAFNLLPLGFLDGRRIWKAIYLECLQLGYK